MRWPSMSGCTKDLPAWDLSLPSMRSPSIGWPHDSCAAIPATSGPHTRSYLPGLRALPWSIILLSILTSSVSAFSRFHSSAFSQPPAAPYSLSDCSVSPLDETRRDAFITTLGRNDLILEPSEFAKMLVVS